jgi:hypothetical protein
VSWVSRGPACWSVLRLALPMATGQPSQWGSELPRRRPLAPRDWTPARSRSPPGRQATRPDRWRPLDGVTRPASGCQTTSVYLGLNCTVGSGPARLGTDPSGLPATETCSPTLYDMPCGTTAARSAVEHVEVLYGSLAPQEPSPMARRVATAARSSGVPLARRIWIRSSTAATRTRRRVSTSIRAALRTRVS